MASCFDFRMRTSSFDLHHLTRGTKMARFSRLFRSKSESDAILQSPKTSPKPSPGAPHRRRFVRVVRNAESEGEEYENPHIVRKYSKDYWEQTQMHKSVSLEGVDRPLPYTVSGNTILKKHGSVDSGDNSPPSEVRHNLIFKEDVQVIEFDKKEKIKKRICYMHDEKLQDSSDDTDTSSSNADFDIKKHRIKARKVPNIDYSSEDDSDATALSAFTSNVTISEVRREDLVLGVIPGAYELAGSSICSPVKEEEGEFNDSGSDASSEISSESAASAQHQSRRDWSAEEEDLSANMPSIASKIMSAHEELKKDDKAALIPES